MQFSIQEDISAKLTINYPTYVYNNESFLKQNNDEEQRHYYILHKDVIKAHAAYTIRDGIAYPPFRSPFGGLEYSPELDQKGLSYIISQLEEVLKGLNVSEIHYHQPPPSYQNDSSISAAFLQLHYDLFQERIFHGIEVNGGLLTERMHKMELRKYHKCLKNGASFKQLKKKEAIETFKWIERHRSIAEKPSSMSWLDLRNASTRNPKTYKVFGVFMDGHLLAATVLVKVNATSAYHFLPTSMVDFQHYRKYSPMVYLVHELCNWCYENGIKLLDLGTSYVDKRIKTSLLQFKEHLGGTKSKALSWRKHL